MADRLEDGDEQCLQQFVDQSPWRPEPVRWRLAVRMEAEICPDAWVIDDTVFPKFGDKSVGVAPQYCGRSATAIVPIVNDARWLISRSVRAVAPFLRPAA